MAAYFVCEASRFWKYGISALAGVATEPIRVVAARPNARNRRRACWIMLRPSNQSLDAAPGRSVNLPTMTARPLLESKQELNGEIVAPWPWDGDAGFRALWRKCCTAQNTVDCCTAT